MFLIFLMPFSLNALHCFDNFMKKVAVSSYITGLINMPWLCLKIQHEELNK